MNEIFVRMLLVILLLVLGKALRYINFLKDSTLNDIRKMIIDIFLPCILFISFVTMDLANEYFILFILIFIMQMLFMLTSLLVNKVKWISNPLIPLISSGCAFGFIGIPFFLVAYGMEELGKYTILGVGHEVYLWMFFFPWVRLKATNQKFSFREVLRILKSPVILSIILGILINKLNLHAMYDYNVIYRGIYNTIEALGDVTTPLILLVVGYGISLDTKLIKDTVKVLSVRMAIIFAVGYAFKYAVVNFVIQPEPVFNHAFFTFLVMPAPLVVPMFAAMYISKKSGELASNVCALNTIVSIVLYMLVLII